MANLCFNAIDITGPRERLKAFDVQFKKKHKAYKSNTIDIKDISTLPSGTKYEEINEVTASYTEVTEEEGYSFMNFAEMSENDYLTNWYGWRLCNWGTKWDVDPYNFDVNLPDKEDLLNYSLSTAWNPAIPVAREMSRQYPDLEITITYEEGGEGFAGKMTLKAGDTIFEEEYRDTKSYRDFLLREFIYEYVGRCPKCGCLIEEDELENSPECPNCDEDINKDTIVKL